MNNYHIFWPGRADYTDKLSGQRVEVVIQNHAAYSEKDIVFGLVSAGVGLVLSHDHWQVEGVLINTETRKAMPFEPYFPGKPVQKIVKAYRKGEFLKPEDILDEKQIQSVMDWVKLLDV